MKLTPNLCILGEKLTDEEVEQLLAGHEDSQGNVHYEEFVRAVMNGWVNFQSPVYTKQIRFCLNQYYSPKQ